MTTVAIIGAGPGLGAAVARRFGAQGYDIALVSRTQSHVDALAELVRSSGVRAVGFAADVRDPGALTDALQRATGELGPIEVLQYSPVPSPEYLRPVLQTTAGDLQSAVDFSVHGAHAAVQQVLGGMSALGRGTVLFVNGGSAVRPNPAVAGTSVAFAGLSAYAQMLHSALAEQLIHVAQLVIPGAIEVGHPTHDPDVLAERLWTLHTERSGFRDFADAMPAS